MLKKKLIFNVPVIVDPALYQKPSTLFNIIVSGRGDSVAVNAEKIIATENSSQCRGAVLKSALPYFDGMPLVQLLTFAGYRGLSTLNLPIRALEIAESAGLPIMIIGGREEIQFDLKKALKDLFPELKLIKLHHGYLDYREIRELVVDSEARVVLLGLGSPKQEIMAQALIGDGFTGFIVPCGGALDVLSGHKRRAPEFIQKLGIEAPYRLIQEPRRYRRYIKLIPFSFRLLKAYIQVIVGKEEWSVN